MKLIQKTRKFNINLKSPYTTYYTIVAEDKDEATQMLKTELEKDCVYDINDFEIDDCGMATNQMGNYLPKTITNQMN